MNQIAAADLRPSPEALHAALLAEHSATAVLERLYGGPVRIRRVAISVPLSPAQLDRLDLRDGAEAVHRRVELLREALVLSEADLWYVPGRLAPAMAQVLAVSDVPFGRVVAPLGPRRRTITAEVHPHGRVAVEHRAVLLLPDGSPLAEVHERYPRR